MSRFWHVLVGMVAAVILAISPAIGSENEHAHEAEYHAEEAVKHAGMGHPKMVAKEAEKGLAFAKRRLRPTRPMRPSRRLSLSWRAP